MRRIACIYAVTVVVVTFTQTGCGQRRVSTAAAAAPQVAPQFAAQAQTFADVTRLLAGTWTLKQRTNPDGTPYRSKLEGVTYISMSSRSNDAIGPHATANVYARETGVADTGFFKYPPEVAGKPFRMESSATWLIHNVRTMDTGAQISVRSYAMAKGDLQPYTNGLVLAADVRYNLTRGAATAGVAASSRMEATQISPGELTDLAGARIQQGLMADGCCGMTSLVINQNTMEIGWSNKGKDVWVRSDTAVPAAFR